LGDGQYKSIAVQLGNSDETHIAITEGLNAGDQVVVSAQFLLDSESSKTSDFKRMYHAGEKKSQISNNVWVAAKVESIDKELRKARIEHAKIEAWSWPVMTMKFGFSDDVDITPLESGLKLHVQLTKQDDGSALITGIRVMDKPKSKPATDHAPVDHSKHDMSH
jgi:Cu(I)/Ag(I) efflux system membrane fusion protein